MCAFKQINTYRHYDPYSGRFLSEDPIGFESGDYNLYRYALNNPIIYRDPTGNDAISDFIKAGICKINPSCCDGSLGDRIGCSITTPPPEKPKDPPKKDPPKNQCGLE